jgi:holo-[acyl-carrier protein] synthase
MIAGIGVDLVSVARVTAVWERHGARFARRLLGEAERAELADARDVPRFLAKRFAVKEAFGKALGTGIAQDVILPDIVLTHAQSGAPALRLAGAAAVHCAQRGIGPSHVSLSDEGDFVIAFVVLEYAAPP